MALVLGDADGSIFGSDGGSEVGGNGRGVTTGVTVGGWSTGPDPVGLCPVCGERFQRVGRRSYCSDACRQAAFRGRHPVPVPMPPQPRPAGRRAVTVYLCSGCEVRQLGVQRCAECGRFGMALGVGAACPCCEEPVAVAELIEG